jgi:hypothetical protein
MSYDFAVWHDAPKCKYSPHAIYRRVCRGLPVDGLRKLPRRKVEKVILGLLADSARTARPEALFLEGHIDETHVEAAITDYALKVSVPILAGGPIVLELFWAALCKELGPNITIYDPLAVRAPSDDHIYEQDYDEFSRDPDLGYWTELNLAVRSSQQFGEYQPFGAQVVNSIEYVFFEVNPPTGMFKFYEVISTDKASIASSRFDSGNLDGGATFAVVVIVPESVISRLSAGFEPREHIRIFTAFADDDHVLCYQHWQPIHNDPGTCATVMSLNALPKRLKTVLSTRFEHRG